MGVTLSVPSLLSFNTKNAERLCAVRVRAFQKTENREMVRRRLWLHQLTGLGFLTLTNQQARDKN